MVGLGSLRRRLLEEGAETGAGYSLEYGAMTSVDLYGAMFQAALAKRSMENPSRGQGVRSFLRGGK